MRKRIGIFIVCVLVTIICLPVYGQQDGIKVTVDGKLLNFDVPPQIVDGRTLVPFRGIFEALGSDVDWDGENKTAIGMRGNTIIKLPIGNKIANINDKDIELDVAARIIDGRTFVPVRVIGESLGAIVEWDGKTKTVVINEMGEKKYVKEYVTFVNGGRGFYTGDIQNEKPNGKGTFTYFSGNSNKAKEYKGEFRNGKIIGEGIYTWINGDKYIGEFKNDKKHGEGTMTWANGDKYVGSWENDVRNGQGTMTWANGDKYVGSWKDDKANGEGTKNWANGNEYVGTWENNKCRGEGTMIWANGDKYVGSWENDLKEGQGTMTWANGDMYVGCWEDGYKNGEGTFTAANGEVSKGEWKKDELIKNDADWNF